jgi:signal peptidase I
MIVPFATISSMQELALFSNIERILEGVGYSGKTSALIDGDPILGVNLSGEMYYYIYDVIDKDLNDESNSVYLCSLSPTEKKEQIMRERFFVKGDVIIYELNGYTYNSLVKNIYENSYGEIFVELENTYNGEIETYSFENDDLNDFEDIRISAFYKLWELFDNPVLITAKEEIKEKNQVDQQIEDEIKSLNKQIADLVFLRSLLLPIDFEKKIDFGQRIAERQKQLSELNFKLVERRLGSKDIFDELFEQSFTEVKHSYTDNYSKSDYGDYFTPNGEKSKLSDELNIMIRTPEFIQWFGDWELAYLYKDTNAQISCSKVIDSNYEPLLVWHGTGAEFSYFKFDNFPATYFAKKKAYSEWFADLHGGDEGYTIPFFLNIRNPLDLRGFGTRKIKAKEFFDYIFLKTGLDMDMLEINPIFTSSNYPPNETWVYLRNNAKMLKKLSESKIHDGIMFFETNPSVPLDKEAHDTEAYIIFEANQCKVASTDRGMLLLSSLKSFLLKNGGQI